MKCAMCGTENVQYFKPDAIHQRVVHTRYGDHTYNEKRTAYYCRNCALNVCYDFEGIIMKCEQCGKEQDVELFLEDLDGRLFCCEDCMFAFHNLHLLGQDSE